MCSFPGRGFFTVLRPVRGPHNLLLNGLQGLYPWAEAGMNLFFHHLLVPRLRNLESFIFTFPHEVTPWCVTENRTFTYAILLICNSSLVSLYSVWGLMSPTHAFNIKQDILETINRLLSSYYIFSISYDRNRIENTAYNSSFIVACAFVAAELFYRAVAWQRPPLLAKLFRLLGVKGAHRHRQQGDSSRTQRKRRVCRWKPLPSNG
jgi:hypothetical protein